MLFGVVPPVEIGLVFAPDGVIRLTSPVAPIEKAVTLLDPLLAT